MKASLIFRICGLFLALGVCLIQAQKNPSPTPNGGDINMETDAPLSILHGEYQIDENDMENYRPTWASVWTIDKVNDVNNGIFYISFWPPKYCHAIYVCPISKQNYNDASNFQTTRDMCESQYVKYYPHAKKLLLKSERTAEEVKYWMKNRLEIDIDGSSQAKLHVLEKLPVNHTHFMYEIANGQTFGLNLENTDLLILTNSRMCQVNKIGSKFHPFFRKAIQKDPASTSFPKWLNDGNKFVQTDYLPSVKATKTPKSIDLLAYLKEKRWTAEKIRNLAKTCEPIGGLRAGGRNKNIKKELDNGSFKKVSVGSYQVHVPNAQFTGKAFKKFTLNVESCHWFRLWVTEEKGMGDYQKEMKLEETVDFFLNEGFYITPESDVANPLPGVNELTKFTFRVPSENNTDNYVDMTFGEMQGAPIYHDQFKFPVLNKGKFKLHIIKAPGCEIGIDSRPLLWQDYTADRPSNMWNFGVCVFTFFD